MKIQRLKCKAGWIRLWPWRKAHYYLENDYWPLCQNLYSRRLACLTINTHRPKNVCKICLKKEKELQ